MNTNVEAGATVIDGSESGLRMFLRSFGPGLLWAGSAIGVSHLVQSTRAGADAGFAMAGVILFALILKYPFFEFGPRYAAATGESLVEGYQRIGSWAVWLYFAIVLVTVVITHAAIVLFTAYLVLYALGSDASVTLVAAIVYGGCIALLWFGRFKALDMAIKVVLLLLAVSTLVAAFAVIPRADFTTTSFMPVPPARSGVGLAFVLAVAGWMPTDIAISVYSSLWTLAKNKTSGVRASVATVRLDFTIAYVGTGILAFAFLMLGAAIMYGSGEAFADAGTIFSTQLIDLYVRTLGGWTQPIIVVTAITAMFSTTLTIIDGYPRVIDRIIQVIREKNPDVTGREVSPVYWMAMFAVGSLTVLVLHVFVGNLTQMVDFVTIVAFLTGPVLGFLNLKVVTSPAVPEEHRPGKAMRIYSYAGLIGLGTLATVFLVSLIS